MSKINPARTYLSKLSILAAASGLVMAIPATAYAAGTGYGAAQLPFSVAAGNQSNVLTARTVSPAGGVVTATSNGVVISVTVPPGTFATPVQLVITTPPLSSISSAILPNYHPITAIGIQFLQAGHPLTGTFTKAVEASIQSSQITPSDKLLMETSSNVNVLSNAVFSNGDVTFSFSTDPSFVVLAPAIATNVAGATTPHTGKPFLLEGLAALGLITLGGGLAIRLLRTAP